MSIEIRRVYDDAGAQARVLVGRLWPRGMRKDDARVGRWLRDVAPSNELRTWCGHDPAKFTEFARRYRAEQDLTLVTATKDIELSHAAVLAAILEPERT